MLLPQLFVKVANVQVVVGLLVQAQYLLYRSHRNPLSARLSLAVVGQSRVATYLHALPPATHRPIRHRFQLFDAVADPEEKTNVYGQHQEIVNRLGRLIRDYIINGRSTPGVAQTNDSVKAWQQTQWLDQFKSTNLATGVIPADQPQ